MEEEGEADILDLQGGVERQRMDWKERGAEEGVEENLCGVEEKGQLQKIWRQNGLVWMQLQIEVGYLE